MSVLSLTNGGTYMFPETVEKELFNKTKGHSSLAKLSAQEPLPFNGKDIFVFDMSDDISVVGENEAKPEGSAAFGPKKMVPIKVVFQMRTSDEFMTASDEYQLNVLGAFTEGFGKKLGSGMDIMAFHGLNPKTKAKATSTIGSNYIDSIAASNLVSYTAATADECLEDCIGKVTENEYEVTGIAISPDCRTDISKIKANGQRVYPDFAFGAAPAIVGGAVLDVNATVAAHETSGTADKIIAGDFANCFRWGIAKNIPIEVIQFGDPDGQGDLKRYNQICLRGEAFIGWAFMDADAFAIAQ